MSSPPRVRLLIEILNPPKSGFPLHVAHCPAASAPTNPAPDANRESLIFGVSPGPPSSPRTPRRTRSGRGSRRPCTTESPSPWAISVRGSTVRRRRSGRRTPSPSRTWRWGLWAVDRNDGRGCSYDDSGVRFRAVRGEEVPRRAGGGDLLAIDRVGADRECGELLGRRPGQCLRDSTADIERLGRGLGRGGVQLIAGSGRWPADH